MDELISMIMLGFRTLNWPVDLDEKGFMRNKHSKEKFHYETKTFGEMHTHRHGLWIKFR